ncbi:tryptophan synthase subunit beta [Pseudomonas aeruginosa]|nr:tryptophan synthase subunit beta [Pseudomonas aeruginosa]
MTSYRNGPDAKGLFGRFGGQYVAETLMPLILDLAREYEKAKDDRRSRRNWPTSSATTSVGRARCTSPSA